MYNHIEEVLDFFKGRSDFGIKPGLDRMYKMLEQIGHPEKRLKVVHIAGTNGKGSTLTFIKEALIHNGYTVGTFTSPSLDCLNDHIHINNQSISDRSFVELLNEITPVIQRLDQQDDHPTEFEIIVIIAIIYLAKSVDVALFETGMGGKEDSTNCLVPLLTIITNIGKDHVQFLGDTYTEIAKHKAGIIKNDVPLITAVTQPDALTVVERTVREKSAPIYQYNREFKAMERQLTEDKKESFTFVSDKLKLLNVVINLKGSHQVTNASLALMALLKLKDIGFLIQVDAIKRGFEKAQFPGRFEQIHERPVVIVDGAHNVEGVDTFLAAVNRYYPAANKHLIFAAFKDKDLEEMIRQMQGQFQTITFTTFHHPRAANAGELYLLSRDNNKFLESDWKKAITANIKTSNKETIIFVTGSLHFIGIVRKYFVNRQDL